MNSKLKTYPSRTALACASTDNFCEIGPGDHFPALEFYRSFFPENKTYTKTLEDLARYKYKNVKEVSKGRYKNYESYNPQT